MWPGLGLARGPARTPVQVRGGRIVGKTRAGREGDVVGTLRLRGSKSGGRTSVVWGDAGLSCERPGGWSSTLLGWRRRWSWARRDASQSRPGLPALRTLRRTRTPA